MNPKGAGSKPISGCWLLPVFAQRGTAVRFLSEPEGMGELSQDVGAGRFSDPRTTRTVDEGRHNATTITARDDPLIVTLRVVIGQ